MWLSIVHSHSIYLWSSVSQRALPTAKTRSSVYTPNTREARVKLALKHTKSRRWSNANLFYSHLHMYTCTLRNIVIPTSSTSSHCIPSPVYPSGQGAHWKPVSVRMHMFCLKQVPAGHWVRGWGCIITLPGLGSGAGLVGLPPRPMGTHSQIWEHLVEMSLITLVSKYCVWS